MTAMPEWIKERIPLDSEVACRRELERCSTGPSFLDHLYTETREALKDSDLLMEELESKAAAEARSGDEKPTATEIKGRVTAWFLSHAASERKRHADAEAQKAQQAEQAQQQAWQEKRAGYGKAYAELKVRDFEDAEAVAQEPPGDANPPVLF